ncbi:hypothetical protein C1637_05095 [Chryseobacterium lactis]|uniref:Transposase n=1 Tax=Chryseobacterium lactis TaxID=1241981 RepID=A0A3G6RI34_CHRLC|nr:hypothetical protein EG342_21065 [Chryseobacterium lactis]AZB04611.1 hypothetical protein EG341_11945 [Chryseobacterium lactis]PNW14342.1 hypothetical protein C1637_05095 [Chryseobacterium lactis]
MLPLLCKGSAQFPSFGGVSKIQRIFDRVVKDFYQTKKPLKKELFVVFQNRNLDSVNNFI